MEIRGLCWAPSGTVFSSPRPGSRGRCCLLIQFDLVCSSCPVLSPGGAPAVPVPPYSGHEAQEWLRKQSPWVRLPQSGLQAPPPDALSPFQHAFEGKAFLPSQLQNSLGGEDFSRGSSLERCEQKTARAQRHQQPWASHITPSSLSLGFLLIKWALLAHSHLLCSRTQRQMRGRCYPHKGQWFLPTLFYKIHYLYF